MWCCYNCNEDFYEPDEKSTTYESYYGVASEFESHTPITIEVCPYCGSDEIEECDEFKEN